MNHHHHHFLLVTLPVQGQINPTIQLATNLSHAGFRVTVATTVNGFHLLQKNLPSLNGLCFATFSDGHDEDLSSTMNPGYWEDLKRFGTSTLTTLLLTLSQNSHRPPVTFLVYTFYLPWAAVVARALTIPSAFLSTQSATIFSVYHHFCNTNPDNGTAVINPSFSLKLPGLPLLTWDDLPTYMLPTSPFHSVVVSVLQQHIKVLEEDPKPCMLVNSFDALEQKSIKSIANYTQVVTIGPLISSPLIGNGNNKSSNQDTYFQWLDSKVKEKSVVYVSFGTIAKLQRRQKEEILHGLIETRNPFLWVLRDNEDDQELKKVLKEKIGEDGGLIVGWCAQQEVLRHKAIGCFMSHCGWNSTLESMAAGVAMVACPQFSDQPMNAKMVEDVWGTGVRAKGVRRDGVEEIVVEREEIRRCLETVMGGGERGEEIKKNAEKWKWLVKAAMKEGGPSQVNLKQFLESLN